MSETNIVYVVGSGAVGMALAACLTEAGRRAIAVRTSTPDLRERTETLVVAQPSDRVEMPIASVGISMLHEIEGIVAVTAKSYANHHIARELAKKSKTGPLVILQNGVNVESPFIAAGFRELYRGVLYLTSQRTSDSEVSFHSIKSSPVGVVAGDDDGLDKVVNSLSTSRLPFHAEKRIQREVWKKAVINSVFNSICPLLETDNGVFMRDSQATELARQVVDECLLLTDKLGLDLTSGEMMEQILQISRSSAGQLISTLQDIRNGRETEIEYLNLEMARVAAAQQPRMSLPRTELLGRMIELKGRLLP
jgi:2-dehydropantoate 2-reductase